MIVVVDFGSQTAHLIARRIREQGVKTEVLLPDKTLPFLKTTHVSGIIFSGGPSSVYEKNAPKIDKEIFSLGIPILAICYGFQLATYVLGGEVISGKKEYGPALVTIVNNAFTITGGLPESFTVWMSHGDEIVKLPRGFSIIGQTEHVPFALAVDSEKKIFGLLFHPEVDHTEYGKKILENFVIFCGLDKADHMHDLGVFEQGIKKMVKDSYVIGAISGGVDSTVAGSLVARAIGDHFLPVYVENGLMRSETKKRVVNIFSHFGSTPHIVSCEKEMLARLKGVSDPEKKRKVIGAFYIEIFEREMEKFLQQGKDVRFLMQGTIYSDVIESKGSKFAHKIKSHHNVGGLPNSMKLTLLEPLRELYKDEVRTIGKQLGIPDTFILAQPFPGPGFAVRIRGEVTRQRLEKEKKADTIVLEELERANLLQNVFLSFPVMTGTNSTAVKGDGKFFGEVIAIRIVESKDVMTATWARVSYDVLQKISSRIVNEVQGISRVVYDISTKPPATMEWE